MGKEIKKNKILNFLIMICFMALVVVVSVNALLSDSLQLYYSFDFNDATDISGNGNDGVVNGGNFIQGKLRDGYNMINTNEYINRTLTFDEDTPFSINFWYYKTNSTIPNDEINILDVYSSSSDDFRILIQIIDWDASGGVTMQLIKDSIGANNIETNSLLMNNTWYMLTFIYNGSQNGANIYINSDVNASGTFTNTGSTSTPLTYRIGSYALAVDYINNTIDEFGLWTKALTQAEISQLYNSGAGYNPFYMNLSISAKNLYNGDSVLNFNVTVDEVFYETTNGFILTSIPANSTDEITIIGNSRGYNQETITDFIPNSSDIGLELNLTTSISRPTVIAPINNIFFSDVPILQISTVTNPSGNDIYYEFTNETTILQSDTSTSYEWTGLSIGTYLWRARACDSIFNTCSNFTSFKNVTISEFKQQDVGNALSLSFINETGENVLSGKLNSLSLTFDSGDEGDYLFTYSNMTETETYNFSLNPTDVNINLLNGIITYSASDFPQRKIFFNESLTGGTLYNQTLYLLDDGSDVTFQVVDIGGSPLEDVLVQASTVIDGSSKVVSSSYTDSAGGITFWLNALAPHTITASKSGYDTSSLSVTPTEGSYTITLTTGTEIDTNNYYQGITYSLAPTNIILNNNTLYNFTFDIDSTFWNLTSYGFSLTDQDGILLDSVSGSTAGGSLLTSETNTSNYTKIYMNYWWNIDGNYLNQSTNWDVKTTYIGQLNIKNFFNNLSNFAGAGWDNFGRTILVLIIIVGVTIWLTAEVGIHNPLGISTAITGLIWVLEYINLLPSLVVGGEEKKYLISSIVTVILIALYVQETSR